MFEWESPFEIYVLLHVLHLCPRYARYYYLGKSIHLVMCHGGPMTGQVLYPMVARVFGISQPVVERDLRLAVSDCAACGPEPFLTEITGGQPLCGIPTVEFINQLALYLLHLPPR